MSIFARLDHQNIRQGINHMCAFLKLIDVISTIVQKTDKVSLEGASSTLTQLLLICLQLVFLCFWGKDKVIP